jgi:hypothetical protein
MTRLIGALVFFLVPILLWLLGTAAIRRKGWQARVFAFVAGSDNRLSLSRLQAFIWTLVIFGSFSAAMAIHKHINSGTKEEIDKAVAQAKVATDRATATSTAADKAVTDAESATQAKVAADEAVIDAEARAKALAGDTTATAETRKAAEDKAAQARADAQAKTLRKTAADKAHAAAQETANKAKADAETANALAKSYNWVEIPAALLALAGIAIGSGVFSSLISAMNREDKTACVTDIASIPQANLKTTHPDATISQNPNALQIKGKGMGKTGRVRLNREPVPILFWKDDGTEIIADVPDGKSYRTLVVDTPNGKLCYELQGSTPNLSLGLPKTRYEFSDLFRDDKNPSTFDLMKFQMFGWTIIAVVIYSALFLWDLRDNIESLPLVPQSIVILTGLSQGGYLTGKAVSNMGSEEKK